MQKEFKVKDKVVMVGEVVQIDNDERTYPVIVQFGDDEFTFTQDGKYRLDNQPILQHLSEIQTQTNVFTEEELEHIKIDTEYTIRSFSLIESHKRIKQTILNKINQLTISQEEKQFLEMAEKFKDRYKVEKL